MAVYSRKEVEAGKVKQADPATTSASVEKERASIPASIQELESEPEPTRKKYTANDPWFIFQHPEATDSFRPSGSLELAGEKIEMNNGRVETQSESIRDELTRRGWRWMNEVF